MPTLDPNPAPVILTRRERDVVYEQAALTMSLIGSYLEHDGDRRDLSTLAGHLDRLRLIFKVTIGIGADRDDDCGEYELDRQLDGLFELLQSWRQSLDDVMRDMVAGPFAEQPLDPDTRARLDEDLESRQVVDQLLAAVTA